MILAKILLAILLASAFLSPASAEIMRLDDEGYTIWLDCDRRGAVKSRYNAQRDQGDFKRLKSFFLDPHVPKRCQQTSTASYKHADKRYDRGHLVPANHLDNIPEALKQSNYMTNVLPQAANMNRGAWLRTEEITECYRDINELLIIGGVIWGDNAKDDDFLKSHGVATPDAYWKFMIRGQDRVIAWIVPNTQEATRQRLDQYLVTVEELEQRTGERFPEAPEFTRSEKPEVSWIMPMGCDKS
jgi:endonuclease G